MKDSAIVNLYWQRDEMAIQETEIKYGRYLMKIAYNVLADYEDCEESVNDTYWKTWESIPPHRPDVLSAYLGKITRRTAIDMLRKRKAGKRGNSEYIISLSEMEDCVSGKEGPEKQAEFRELGLQISNYLWSLPEENRDIFVCRYFYMDAVREIAGYSGYSESKIKSMLHRMRMGLRKHLEKEGFEL